MLLSLLIKIIPKSLVKYFIKEYDFVWLVHPRGIDDFVKKFPWGRFLPIKVIEFINWLIWPIIVSDIEGVRDKNNELKRGCIVGISLFPRQFLFHRKAATKKIISALKLSYKIGAKIVSLGGFTTTIIKEKELIKNISLTLINGYNFLILLAFQGIKKALILKNKKILNTSFAIIGATTAIGKTLSKLLIKEGATNLLFIGKTEENLKKLKAECQQFNKNIKISYSLDISDIINYDFIIVAVNSSDIIIKPEYLKKEAIVFDITQPQNISIETLKKRKDLLILDEVTVKTEGVDYNFNLGLPKETCFACVGEAMLLVKEGRINKSYINEPNMKQIDEINHLARKYNFNLAALTSFGKGIKNKK